MRPPGHDDYPHYIFSDDSEIGRVKASEDNSSNYRFFEIEPIKWIVLNYNYLPSQYGTGGDGTYTKLELLANEVLVGGIPFGQSSITQWDKSLIYNYLNTAFINETFSKTLLPTSTIYNSIDSSDININTSGSNSNYLQGGSNSTTQELYLLSYYEVVNEDSPYIKNMIFNSGTSASTLRQVTATDYARAHNLALSTNGTTSMTSWWLRSTDGSNVYRSVISGTIGGVGANVLFYGTRPAMQGGQECPF